MPIQTRLTPDGRQTYKVKVDISRSSSSIFGTSRLVQGSFRPATPTASTAPPPVRDSPSGAAAQPGAGLPS